MNVRTYGILYLTVRPRKNGKNFYFCLQCKIELNPNIAWNGKHLHMRAGELVWIIIIYFNWDNSVLKWKIYAWISYIFIMYCILGNI